MQRSTGLSFTVKRHPAEFIVPAKPTPRELKPLSDIDDQQALRFHIPLVLFYPAGGDRMRDPAQVIRAALAEALVYYYPWAGRLREAPNGKLMVDCTAEGVLFVAAEADVSLEDISVGGEEGFLQPPFPCFDKLLFHVPGSSRILHSPLLLLQVTRLRCGGVVVALRLNHAMTDATGLIKLLYTVAELARGASCPSVLPVWSRELLLSRDPPRVTCIHKEYDQLEGSVFPFHHLNDKVIERSFFFGPTHISSIRHLLQPHHQCCTTFELLSAFLWRCRTIALRYEPNEEVRYLCLVNARSKLNPPIPAGYYGNVVVYPAAVSTSKELSRNNLGYAVELIKKAKAQVTEEYVRSVTDLMVTTKRPLFTVPGTWIVSDNTQMKYLELNFGWGKPMYGGPASALVGVTSGPIGFLVKGMNEKGESGNFLVICLPEPAMYRFAREIDMVVGNNSTNINSNL